MKTELAEIESFLKETLKSQCPPLQVRKDGDAGMEVAGTIPAMQGKQKVDGFYFASIVPKPKDIRFYFFPIYTHSEAFSLSDELKKALKGKSCFHIKKLSPDMESEIAKMVQEAAKLYKKEGLI